MGELLYIYNYSLIQDLRFGIVREALLIDTINDKSFANTSY